MTWTDARSREGRKVTLDALGKIVSIVSYMVPVQPFAAATLLINCTGTEMHRRPKALRPSMPDWCLYAQFHNQLRLFAGPFVLGSLPTLWRHCVVCVAVAETEFAAQHQMLDGAMEVVVCGRCMCPYHRVCAEVYKLTGSDINDLDNGFLCKYCRGPV